MDDQLTEWHSVRPWNPTLSLSVREITSVSVTFILSSPYSTADSANADLASLGLSSSDDDDQSRDSNSTVDTTQSQVVSDILAKGLSVKVNGTPWQRVILKMDDMLDEAIIILYGLMPSRQYDVELGILPGESTVRSQITTDNEVRPDATLSDSAPEEIVLGSSESSTLSSSPTHASAGAHTPNGHLPSFTLEDRRVQLTHALSLLTTEHLNLTASLKSARRDSQKADAALRSEIEILKRASDKYAAGEGRARKKVLALQEAVKQTLAAARDIEAEVKDIEAALPALEVRKVEVEKEWVKVRGEAERVHTRREEVKQQEKARTDAMQAELTTLANRLEKLNGKRERFEGEGGVLAELEGRLRRLEEERERVERDPYGYNEGSGAGDDGDSGFLPSGERTKDDSSPEAEHDKLHPSHPHFAGNNNHHPHPNFHPQQHAHPRKRHSHPHVQHPHQHHHPRPSFPPRPMAHQESLPVHRPAAARASFPAGSNHVPGMIHLQHGHPQHPLPNKPVHAPHNNSLNNHPHAHQRPPFRPHGSSGSSSTSGSGTPGGLNGGAGGSMLSSRAPPFEPSRSRAHSQSHTPQAPIGARSDLNPGSTPFSPRSNVAQAVGAGAPGRA